MVSKRSTQWTSHDAALGHTCIATHALLTSNLDRLPRISVPFALRFAGHQESVLATADFNLSAWKGRTNGRRLPGDELLSATRTDGVPMTATFAFVRSPQIGTRQRKPGSAAAARKWKTVSGGLLYVSSHGIYLNTGDGLQSWPWAAFDGMTLNAPGTVHIQGRSSAGTINWKLTSLWSELTFVLWALTRHPHHPQLVDGSWLPDGWTRRAADYRYVLPDLSVIGSGAVS